jgi:hypothetical protein
MTVAHLAAPSPRVHHPNSDQQRKEEEVRNSVVARVHSCVCNIRVCLFLCLWPLSRTAAHADKEVQSKIPARNHVLAALHRAQNVFCTGRGCMSRLALLDCQPKSHSMQVCVSVCVCVCCVWHIRLWRLALVLFLQTRSIHRGWVRLIGSRARITPVSDEGHSYSCTFFSTL